jgi:hypothetical protein
MKPLQRKLLTCGALLLFNCFLYGQQTIISGQVSDAESGEPLPFVNISFKNSKIGTTTDLEGNYRIETYYATDTLIASFIGYQSSKRAVRRDQQQTINFSLSPGSVALQEVVIEYTGNPAHVILEKVKQNKAANNREKYDFYQYEVYNKVQFDLNNITEEFKQRKLFKNFQFIFKYVDSTEEKPFLPMFMTESLSDFYYQREPKSEKEYIKASKISGTSNESITQFMGDMYQKVNIYENYIDVFGKTFVSPIADNGLNYYRYYLKDSLMVDGHYCFEIDFVPKHKQEPVFEGSMWISDTTYAVKKIVAGISESANINFINGFRVEQEYEMVEEKYWMLKRDHLVVDFELGENIMGLYGRKSTSYKNFRVNQPIDPRYFAGVDNVEVKKDALDKSEAFWHSARHDTLTKNQQGIYEMVDSVQKVPAFKTFVDVVQLIFTGYKEIGKVELGPYFKMYSYNPVEGHRFRFGGRTSNNFSTRLMLHAYLAYGTNDERFKYAGGFLYKLNNNPRETIAFEYMRDVEQLGQSQNAFAEDNILSSFLRRNPNNKLTDVESYKATYFKEWISGFSNQLFLTKRLMRPLGQLEYNRFNPYSNEGIVADKFINTAEVSLYTRFAYKETFVEGEFERVSLGSRYPVLELQTSFGIQGLFDSDYNYQKLEVAITDEFNIGLIGEMEYRATAGKYFGTLPYPLLEIHNGNETYFYDQQAFNLMNFFEFISDEYASIMITHHFDGYFLNKIPLFRKLKWREVVSFRSVAGSLEDKHRREMILPANIFQLREPYMEVGAGIENIFKIIRIDALWRLNYLDHPNIAKFGIRGAFEFSF